MHVCLMLLIRHQILLKLVLLFVKKVKAIKTLYESRHHDIRTRIYYQLKGEFNLFGEAGTMAGEMPFSFAIVLECYRIYTVAIHFLRIKMMV